MARRLLVATGAAALALLLLLPLVGGRLGRLAHRVERRVERVLLRLDATPPRERASTPEGLAVWVVSESKKVRPGDTLGSPRRSGDPPVRLQGARGETVAFQLVLAARDPVAVDVEVDALDGGSGRIGREGIEVFLEVYVACPPVDSTVVALGPGEFPDPLVPLWDDGGARVAAPVRLTPRRNQPLWVDVSIPRDAAPGAYRGQVRLRGGGVASVEVPLELEVLSFEIPRQTHLAAWVPLYATRLLQGERAEGSDSPALRGVYWRYQEMAHAHRFWTQIMEDQPRAYWDESIGSLRGIDWSSYDALNGPVLDGSLFEDGEPPPGWKVGGFVWWGARPGDPPHFGGDFQRDTALTPAHRRALGEYARAFRDHFDEKGWSRPRLFMYMVDEPALEAYPRLVSLISDYGKAIHAARADVAHLVTVGPHPDLHDAIDIWATWGAGYVPRRMQERQGAGDRAWFYQQHEPFVGGSGLNDEGLGMRSWPWIAWRYGVDGIFLWVGNFWNDDPYRNPVNWTEALLGNGVLFYPGARLPTIGFPAIEGPVSSFRMKALRRGLFDYEYFRLLREAGGDADALVSGVVRSALNEEDWTPHWRHPLWGQHGDWDHDPARWEAARREAARQILERRGESAP